MLAAIGLRRAAANVDFTTSKVVRLRSDVLIPASRSIATM
jgi:hypothetical protein